MLLLTSLVCDSQGHALLGQHRRGYYRPIHQRIWLCPHALYAAVPEAAGLPTAADATAGAEADAGCLVGAGLVLAAVPVGLGSGLGHSSRPGASSAARSSELVGEDGGGVRVAARLGLPLGSGA